MKPEQMAEALETAAAQLGVKVRYDALTTAVASGAGGLCRVKGQWLVIMDKKSSPSERASILAEALATFDTDTVFLPPKVREAVQLRRAALPPRSGQGG
jgi:hypothetical protein